MGEACRRHIYSKPESKGVIEEPEGQRNFRGFDYRAYLKTQGIYHQIRIETIQSALPVQTWNVFDWLSQWRRQAIVWSKDPKVEVADTVGAGDSFTGAFVVSIFIAPAKEFSLTDADYDEFKTRVLKANFQYDRETEKYCRVGWSP